jgi:hypothetical protein
MTENSDKTKNARFHADLQLGGCPFLSGRRATAKAGWCAARVWWALSCLDGGVGDVSTGQQNSLPDDWH